MFNQIRYADSLQFAAAAANVELCAFLIDSGADNAALAYEGPSKNAL
jgi:hypothetical protein